MARLFKDHCAKVGKRRPFVRRIAHPVAAEEEVASLFLNVAIILIKNKMWKAELRERKRRRECKLTPILK